MAERMEPTDFRQRILDSVPQLVSLEVSQEDGTAYVHGRIATDTGLKRFTSEYLKDLTREYADEIVDVLTTELR